MAKISSKYLQLIHTFPLRPIRSEAELERAEAMLHRLLDAWQLSAAEQDYREVLGNLIEEYESEAHPNVRSICAVDRTGWSRTGRNFRRSVSLYVNRRVATGRAREGFKTRFPGGKPAAGTRGAQLPKESSWRRLPLRLSPRAVWGNT